MRKSIIATSLVLCAAVVCAQDNLDLPVTPLLNSQSSSAAVTSAVTPPPDEKSPRDEPPPVFFGEEIDSESSSIFYVIDVSGSMEIFIRPVATTTGNWGETVFLNPEDAKVPTRLRLAQNELKRSIEGLPENFRFNVMSFDCTIWTWQLRMVAATPENKASACAWVEALVPRGATGTGPAVSQALRMEPTNLSVVLLTDGIPNCPFEDTSAHKSTIRSSNSQNAQIDVFGILAEGGWRAWCRSVASENSGNYFDVQ